MANTDPHLGLADADYRTGQIKIHSPADFEGMRVAGRLAAECLDMLIPHVVPGVVTDHLDTLAREFILDHGALPACLGYRGYTRTVCISPNHIVCHGIPGDRTLREGDIANIDVTVIVDGWHGDTSRMYGVGPVAPRAKRLIDVTYEAIERGLSAVKPGARTGDIGFAIQSYVESMRCSVVRDFCGHGLGKVFHDAPNILHFGQKGTGELLRPGMFFTIEPMVNLGKFQVKLLSDGWTAVTRDKSLSAQCEHSIGVTETGYEVFTLSPAGLYKPPVISA
ncbi:MAG: methionine aminopeptidase [Phenylobacterium sp.]|jgi:methionyl aminopeptidase|uniref:type I methionyl aminopeptidase n=1 Tax=Phenylobacterium sp. TaxID=1871053 RepID=UPI0026337465|nr:type I methionyl aminopeptidase [Phenylobacterium sp.]MDB5498757.1 methionine aminopeptidase [Phenylobacterium sp.]